jgi:thiol-disulfide isomerase/thioredoxin
MVRPLLIAAAFGAFAALAAPAVLPPAWAAVPPQAGIASFAELKTPLPYPYSETADANAQVAKAMARAKARHKLLLIDLGGNWCGDCRVLAGTIDIPSIKAFVDGHYELVSINVGRFDTNLQIPAHYGLTQRLIGVPTMLVVDPRQDKLLNPGDVFALSDARSMTPQALADWLAKWVK